ncbi:saccharopine dehydrogenase family protein [Mycolicibacterium canariasense]|uniref:Saccharopine dehydrogenase family protein n=2 Tax=Mycolicibacterium canariasense TaxID=228230 RepID=A0A117I8V7_MYCCR|nr:saccharopine dehydrogenase family protein [Mycolicibacterium canariasense]
MIYGATGYTGRMAAQHAAAAGLKTVLAGRDAPRLTVLAAELGLEHRSFALDNAATVDDALREVSVVLNCAGPFIRTARPLMAASIRSGVHYLDTAAELDSYHLAETLDQKAEAAGVMLLPGSGGSVAMLGCLTAHAARRITDPQHVRVALHVAGSMSRGSAISAANSLSAECLERVGGVLVSRDPHASREFDFGMGPVACTPVTLPDLVTIWHATAIPHIETYVYVSGNAFPTGVLSDLPEGPSREQREANRYQASVEITGANGSTVRSVLDTVNGYTFTPTAAVEAARRVLAGEHRPGFQTPAELFGSRFAETIADTTLRDL